MVGGGRKRGGKGWAWGGGEVDTHEQFLSSFTSQAKSTCVHNRAQRHTLEDTPHDPTAGLRGYIVLLVVHK